MIQCIQHTHFKVQNPTHASDVELEHFLHVGGDVGEEGVGSPVGAHVGHHDGPHLP